MANLLDKASYVLLPGSTSNGKVHGLKPEQEYSGELIVNGDFSSSDGWTVPAGSSITDGQLILNSPGTYTMQSSIFLHNKRYEIIVDVEDFTSGSFEIVSGGFVHRSPVIDTPGIHKFVFEPSAPTNQNIHFTYQDNPVCVVNSISVREILVNTDLEFTRGSRTTTINSEGKLQGVEIISDELIDNPGITATYGPELNSNVNFDEYPTSTNQFTHTEDATNNESSQHWQRAGNTIVTPVDVATIDYQVYNVAFNGGTCFWYQAKPHSLNEVGERATISFWAKSNTGNEETFRAFIDNGARAKSFTVGNEWTHIVYSNETSINTSRNAGIIQDGPNTCDILVYGMQLEASRSFASPYIPSGATATTRAGNDTVNMTPVEQAAYKIENGKLILDSDLIRDRDGNPAAGDYVIAQLVGGVTVGKLYKVEMDIEVVSGYLELKWGLNYGNVPNRPLLSAPYSGTYTFYVKAQTATMNFTFNQGSDTYAEISSWSVKEMTGLEEWTTTGESVIEDGKIRLKGDGSYTSVFTNSNNIKAGELYEVELFVEENNGEANTIQIIDSPGGGVDMENDANSTFEIEPNTLYTKRFIGGANGGFGFKRSNSSVTTDITLSYVSVRHITDENDLARVNFEDFEFSERVDATNVLGNANFSELGPEILGDPKLANPSNAVTASDDTLISFRNGGIHFEDDAEHIYSYISAAGTTTVGKTYRLDIRIDNVKAGKVIVDSADSAKEYGEGFHSVYFRATGTSLNIKRSHITQGGYNFDITYLALYEVDPNDNWDLTGGVFIDNDKLNFDVNSGNFLRALQYVDYKEGATYEISLDVEGDGSTNQLELKDASVSNKPGGLYERIDLLSGVNSYTFRFTVGNGSDSIYIKRYNASGNYDFTVSNIVLREVKETLIKGSGKPSILLANTTSNIITFSNLMENKGTQVATSEYTTIVGNPKSVNGLSRKIISTQTNGQPRLDFYPPAITEDTTYTHSVFVRRGNVPYVGLGHYSTNDTCIFDFDNEVFTRDDSGTAGYQKLANGWYRIWHTLEILATESNNLFKLHLCNHPTDTVSSEAEDYAYFYGAMLETKDYCSPYLPNEGTTTSASNEFFHHNQPMPVDTTTDADEFTVYFESYADPNMVSNNGIVMYKSGNDDRLGEFQNGSRRIFYMDCTDDTRPIDYPMPVGTDDKFLKVAFAVDNVNLTAKLFIDGVLVQDVTMTDTISLPSIRFNTSEDGIIKHRAFITYPEALTDLELSCLTAQV